MKVTIGKEKEIKVSIIKTKVNINKEIELKKEQIKS